MLSQESSSFKYLNNRAMKMVDEYFEKIITQAEDAVYEGEYFEAERMLINLLTYEPGYAKVHNNLGWMYLYYLENDELAEIHLNYAIKFEPEYKPPYLHLTELYMRNKQYDKLEELAIIAKSVNGISKTLVYERLGMVDEARGQYKLAIGNYKTAIFHCMDNQAIEDIRQNIKRCRFKRIRFIKAKWRLQK